MGSSSTLKRRDTRRLGLHFIIGTISASHLDLNKPIELQSPFIYAIRLKLDQERGFAYSPIRIVQIGNSGWCHLLKHRSIRGGLRKCIAVALYNAIPFRNSGNRTNTDPAITLQKRSFMQACRPYNITRLVLFYSQLALITEDRFPQRRFRGIVRPNPIYLAGKIRLTI